MTAAVLDIRVRRRRPRRQRQRYPDQLHVFAFRFAREGFHTPHTTVLVRGRMGHVAAIGLAHDEARRRGRNPACRDVMTVPAPRPTPALDALARRCTQFPTMLALLTAAAGYRPTIRLDLLGRDGLALALAYDRQQARWGNPRRAFVTGELLGRPPPPAPAGLDGGSAPAGASPSIRGSEPVWSPHWAVCSRTGMAANGQTPPSEDDMPDNQTSAPGPNWVKDYISWPNIERAAKIAQEKRREAGEIMTYHLDGWVVREHPGQRIVRLAPIAEFRYEDFPDVA